MNMKRVTITVPQYLYNNLTKKIPAGGISRFVRTAVEKEFSGQVVSPVDEFLKLRRKLAKYRLSRQQILATIRKGRA